MHVTTIKLVTIIAEGVLETRLIEEIKDLGARGYTISEVRGRGTRGITTGFWEGHQVKIELLVNATVAEQILEHLESHYFVDYAVIAYMQSVDVVRKDKYQ
ncbi:MAG: nitrogen regulatory protein P-II [Chloroflexi bacterium AL-W]|nr:nitrogen regulatory protein P-II [Chloroflexi bacterium AL-N1]NOK70329.1 nitrogen regulatory protein P-II [Chloroflexi bacterium AL-N10]NOK78007.1 nitrogen regulatory protein P-II [Chloroflexi bacterium AL-N5]NOK85106.1 nitrogen regulatory protein P-II [Chloroflexi bacterium AL-W]NOK92095.1 nitrogen regulatory protein P-II [Chloroflexi bacterium AL-N15]